MRKYINLDPADNDGVYYFIIVLAICFIINYLFSKNKSKILLVLGIILLLFIAFIIFSEKNNIALPWHGHRLIDF